MIDININALSELDIQQHNAETSPPLTWQSEGRTHIGKVRYKNEDAYLESAAESLWLVADGMGGFSRGDYASQAIVKSLSEFTKLDTMSSSIQDIEARLIATNDKCLTAFKGKRIGSTVAALFSFENYCYFLWAGDTRIYRLRDGEFKQMTTDHSVAQEKLDRGELSYQEARDHPSAHQLTRAVGAHKNLTLALRRDEAKPNDRFFICSDGLYYAMSDEEMQSKLDLPVDEALDALFSRALDFGGRDNITAIIIDAKNS